MPPCTVDIRGMGISLPDSQIGKRASAGDPPSAEAVASSSKMQMLFVS